MKKIIIPLIMFLLCISLSYACDITATPNNVYLKGSQVVSIYNGCNASSLDYKFDNPNFNQFLGISGMKNQIGKGETLKLNISSVYPDKIDLTMSLYLTDAKKVLILPIHVNEEENLVDIPSIGMPNLPISRLNCLAFSNLTSMDIGGFNFNITGIMVLGLIFIVGFLLTLIIHLRSNILKLLLILGFVIVILWAMFYFFDFFGICSGV